MLLLDYHNTLIQSLLTERFSEYGPAKAYMCLPTWRQQLT